MSADSPLTPPSRKGAIRAAMWEDPLAAHAAGRVRALEVRASDYLGPQVTSAMAAQVAPARISAIPRTVLRAVGLLQPQLREVVEVLHQFEAPFIASHAETTRVFGLEPTPWQETIESVVAARRSLLAV